jgi:hypothetical protein
MVWQKNCKIFRLTSFDEAAIFARNMTAIMISLNRDLVWLERRRLGIKFSYDLCGDLSG